MKWKHSLKTRAQYGAFAATALIAVYVVGMLAFTYWRWMIVHRMTGG